MAPVKSRAVASGKAKKKRKGFRGVQKQFVNLRNGGNQTATSTRSADDNDHVASSGQYDDSSSIGITTTQKNFLLIALLLEQDDIPFTRTRTADLGLNTSSTSSSTVRAKGYALIDLDLLASFIKNNLTCQLCLSRRPSFVLLSNEKKRYGLAINFDAECSNCSNKIQCESSKSWLVGPLMLIEGQFWQ